MLLDPQPPYFNPRAKNYISPPPAYTSTLEAFHQSLPTYAGTPLRELPRPIAEKFGLQSVYLKDESSRFGLPSFKILGASWAVYCAICKELGISMEDVSKNGLPIGLNELAVAASQARIRLVLCTDGNWGRAVAFTARWLGVAATVYVPEYVDVATRDLIQAEGAEVRVFRGDYDAAIQAAIQETAGSAGDHHDKEQRLLVMDTSWEGYEEIPRWVTQGYETMLTEVDDSFSSRDLQPDLVIVSVGVGSWAHAVVQHYKSLPLGNRPLIATVEPNNAASLLASLQNDRITPITTFPTIMAGMNCGTTSEIAWPFLRHGVDLALTVTDMEAHEAVIELKEECGIDSGPCGAATFAALKKIMAGDLLKNEAFGSRHVIERLPTVVLFSTEGWRKYEIPTAAS